MLCLPYLLSSAQPGEATSPLILASPPVQPGREPLRHIIIGSPEGVRGAINHLHLLRYAEQLQWSKLFTIPEPGIVISRQQGEVFSYLLRHRQLD
jgi:hypothetical protein